MVTLGNAAKQLGISKPTISKAIAKGHLSAARRDDGSFAIDPSELVRWWDSVKHRFQPQPVVELQPATHSEHSETTDGNGVADRQHEHPGNGGSEVARRLAALEAEVRGLRDLVAEVKASRDDAKVTADQWRIQAERLTMVLPAPLPAPATSETSSPSEALHPLRSWLRRLAG
jgi:excisionase family DNA binding protein